MTEGYLASVPQPWTRADIEIAYFKSFSDLQGSIDDMPGSRLWDELARLSESVQIFSDSVAALLDEIALFAERSKSDEFWHEESQADSSTRAVRKKLVDSAAAAMALVDHARRFERHYPVEGYDVQLGRDFSEPNLHAFIQDLRRYGLHRRVIRPNWRISSDVRSGERTTTFVIGKAELEEWGGWRESALVYIRSANGQVDIAALFRSYRKHVHSFYMWHYASVVKDYLEILRPALECMRYQEDICRKTKWALLLSRAKDDVQPLTTLTKYQPRDQVGRLLSRAPDSAAQANELVSMLNLSEVWTEAMRSDAEAVFERATSGSQEQ